MGQCRNSNGNCSLWYIVRPIQYLSWNEEFLNEKFPRLLSLFSKKERKIFRKIFNSVFGVCFPFLKMLITCRIQFCTVGVLYNTNLGCQRGLEAWGVEFKTRYRISLYVPQDTRWDVLSFQLAKLRFLWQNFRVFGQMGFSFSENTLFRRNRYKRFALVFFQKFHRIFPIFVKKPYRKFMSYMSVETSV